MQMRSEARGSPNRETNVGAFVVRSRPMGKRSWRRRYRYEEGVIRGNIRVVTPISEDAPYEEQDARLWARLLGLLIVVVAVVAAMVWLFS